MSTTTSTARVEADVAALRAPTLAWALRRTALAVVILVVAIGGGGLISGISTAAKALKAYLDLEPNLDPATRQQLEQTLAQLQAIGTTPSTP